MTLFRLAAGLLFGLSLAVTGYMLMRVWPVAPPLAPADLWPALLRNAGLLALFAVHHSLFARAGIKQWLRSRLDDGAQRSLYVWTASLLLLVTMLAWQPVGHVAWTLPAGLRPLAPLVQLAGVLLIAAAARVIDALELAGLRPPSRDRLDVRGPYRLVRHPIYLGFLLIVWSPAAMTGDRLAFASLSTLYLLIAIPLEERSMQRSLGAPYEQYRARVRSRVVPGIY